MFSKLCLIHLSLSFHNPFIFTALFIECWRFLRPQNLTWPLGMCVKRHDWKIFNAGIKSCCDPMCQHTIVTLGLTLGNTQSCRRYWRFSPKYQRSWPKETMSPIIIIDFLLPSNIEIQLMPKSISPGKYSISLAELNNYCFPLFFHMSYNIMQNIIQANQLI